MKGFGIYIKNDLLEPKHVEKMGTAVWLYLLLIDKMTSIDEDGVGKVLGGRPIKYEEIQAELGISQDTYTRWMDKLLEYPYIETTRTPYGIAFRVFKAKKSFRKIAERYRKNAESNIRLNKDKTITQDAATSAAPRVDTFFKKNPKDESALMSLADFVLMCRGSAHRHIRIIGEYAQDRDFNYTTRGQWREIGVRNLRTAKRLSPFTDRQLTTAADLMDKDLKENGGFISSWTLETIEKYLEQI